MIYNVGSIAAAPTVPFTTDRFGRRAGMFTGALIIIIGTCVQWVTPLNLCRKR
jgi:MFS family permease